MYLLLTGKLKRLFLVPLRALRNGAFNVGIRILIELVRRCNYTISESRKQSLQHGSREHLSWSS